MERDGAKRKEEQAAEKAAAKAAADEERKAKLASDTVEQATEFVNEEQKPFRQDSERAC